MRPSLLKFRKNQSFFEFILYVALIPYLIFIVFLQYKRATAFGCFDDCFNYMGGYFLLKGKHLYSEIFFNHQVLMAYFSFIIQKIFHPSSLYKLVIYHRFAIYTFSFLFDVFLLIRFRLKAFGLIIVYELTKIYLFGDRFLAEAFIVYPLIYFLGIIWTKIKKQQVQNIEYIFCGGLTWFIIFMREPYIPLAIFLYVLILWQAKKVKTRLFSCFVFLILCILTFSSISLKDFYFNVFTVNATANPELIGGKTFGASLLQSFFYPVTLFFDGKWNDFRIFLITIDLVFLIEYLILIVKKEYVLAAVIFTALGLANIRVVIPGQTYYEAFHMIQWYGLFLTVIFFGIKELFTFHRTLSYLSIVVLTIAFLFICAGPQAFVREKIDSQKQFVTNFGNYVTIGDVIKRIASPADTLFVDKWDDMIIWEAGIPTVYKYSWYTSVMPFFAVYRNAREQMLRNYPPTFFYGYCPPHTKVQVLPTYREGDYQRLYFGTNATCLYLKKSKVTSLSTQQLNDLRAYQFHL